MPKAPSTKVVSGEVLKEFQNCRPLRLFINKQRKKGDTSNTLVIRSTFTHLSTEKQLKYYQKAVNKFIALVDEHGIDEKKQSQGHLFETVLTKKQQWMYFQSLQAPTRPFKRAADYYSQVNKEKSNINAKAWKDLTAKEKRPYIKMLKDQKENYAAQTQNFAKDLPERLQPEYLALLEETRTRSSNGKKDDDDDDDEHSTPAPGSIIRRRKSVQSIPESFKPTDEENPHKLTRQQLDALHKCKPNELYYEKKVSDEQKQTFTAASAKNAYSRSLFNQVSEKKRKKFILKATNHWQEYLQENPVVVEQQIPTLNLLLTKNDDILFYFTTLGLPARPPNTALTLYNQEREQPGSQPYWNDLSLTTKDEYMRRLSKIKADYHQKFCEFVEKTLPSDYVRLEFFRNVKHAGKDYQVATKDRPTDKLDEGQLKITQYMQKKKVDPDDRSEFDRIKQQLLATNLNNEQKQLVERLGKMMSQWIKEKADSQTSSTAPKSIQQQKSQPAKDPIVLNGDLSSDNIEPSEAKPKKRKKKQKQDKSEGETVKEHPQGDQATAMPPPSKKRK